MYRAFVIHQSDNVATVLQEVPAGETVTLLGDSSLETCKANEQIRPEHKIAIKAIAKGESVTKYGMPIGHANQDIAAGTWVHLHNCSSNYDERSNTLDGDSGAPTDIEYV